MGEDKKEKKKKKTRGGESLTTNDPVWGKERQKGRNPKAVERKKRTVTKTTGIKTERKNHKEEPDANGLKKASVLWNKKKKAP